MICPLKARAGIFHLWVEKVPFVSGCVTQYLFLIHLRGMNETKDLSAKERALWRAQMRDVHPLKKKTTVITPVEETPGKFAPRSSETRRFSIENPPLPVEVLPLSRKARRTLQIAAHCDLHGYTVKEASQILLRFLEESQCACHKVVLLITGKGKNSPERSETLQHLVPQWLKTLPFSAYVYGFSPTSPKHGGTGALYLFIRRLPSHQKV
jgi:DNA-nicking Smr family endonuclease